jgi:protein-disulfide isomerase
MIKSKIIQLFIAGTAGLLISCSIENNENSDQTINELKDGQQVIIKKIASLEKSVANLAVASKNKPAADNKKQQPPQADPNKVYNIEIGDSFTIGPKNAKVTIVEWMDFQ